MYPHHASGDVAKAQHGNESGRPRRRRTCGSIPLRSVSPLLLAGCLASLPAACADSFSPIAPSELRYSVFGYLDASADTQWIRVMPIRPLVPTAPDSFAATVTLEHLNTGRVITLRDSLFTY